MANHTEFVLLAKEMICEEGRTIRLQLIGSSAIDHSKPWKGQAYDNVEKELVAGAVFVPVVGRDLGTIVKDQDLLKKAKQIAIVEPVEEDLEEKVSRIKDIDGTMWRVVWCQCLKPATQTILYVMGLDK